MITGKQANGSVKKIRLSAIELRKILQRCAKRFIKWVKMVRLALHSIAYEAKTLNLAKEGYTAFYVDGTNGLDTHDGGSWGQAFKTIQHAIDEAESWATIFIRAGTYVESVNIPATKDSISLVGDHPTGTIIRPSSSYAIYVQGEACSISNLTAIGAEVGLGAGMYITGDYVDVKDCVVGNSVAVPLAGKGLYCDSEYGKIMNVSLHQTDLAKYGIHIDDDNIEVSNCYLKNAYTYAILFGSDSYWNRVHDNTIIDCGTYGIYVTGIANYNAVYHNNIINSSGENVRDDTVGKVNRFFENFYDDHTTDTNNDGLCDTPYSFTTNTDYQPVSRRNGWNQTSVGYGSNIVSKSGTATLNDANVSDTIVPTTLPTKMNIIFDISNLNNNLDDFTLEAKVGVSGSERVVAYYKLTSDGADITIDKGSGIGAVVKQRKIDISNILVYTGEQVLLNYTKNGATDRNVTYKYVCGV